MELPLNDLFSAQFKRGGRTQAALDCQGLFLEVMRRYGHEVRDTDVASYATEVVAAAVAGETISGKWQRIDTPEPGCAVLLALESGTPELCQHLGVYIGCRRFIHILESRGVMISMIDDRFFGPKIRGYYRWIG